jgi:hypothetical protein
MKKIVLCITVLLAVTLGVGYAHALPYLVYEPGGDQSHIQTAMTNLGFSFDVRDASNPVTAADLGSHEALVIGWSASGYDMSGLSSAVLSAGITGNKILTGHDADYHTWAGVPAAETFMERAVLFAGAAAGPGILAFPVNATDPFSYLPSAWGISSFDSLAEETITSITPAGVASGLYSGLSLADLSNWGNSYHAGFTAWDPMFSVFETGSYRGGTNVTIGTTVTPVSIPEPASLVLIGAGILGMGLMRKRIVK